jgi:hypothetical protein
MDWSFGDILWTMLVFLFWTMAIWTFISIFGDVFRRRDLSGAAKAGWILLLFVLPFVGALIYLIARPAVTEQDREDMERIQQAKARLDGYSAADEVAKLTRLRDEGSLSAEEYEDLKRKALLKV